jgi:hypothetical protein
MVSTAGTVGAGVGVGGAGLGVGVSNLIGTSGSRVSSTAVVGGAAGLVGGAVVEVVQAVSRSIKDKVAVRIIFFIFSP